MPKEWTRKITDQTSVELEVNLASLFDGKIVPDSVALREAIGQKIIDIIRERTHDEQKSWTGSQFKKYSDEYADSIEFAAYGKSKSEPNLTQTGDMLGLLTIKSSDPSSVVIGWNDTLQSEKAHGHITGAVGVKRDFLGLTNGELNSIKDAFNDQVLEPLSGESNLQNVLSAITNRPTPIQGSVASVVDLFFGDSGEEP